MVPKHVEGHQTGSAKQAEAEPPALVTATADFLVGMFREEIELDAEADPEATHSSLKEALIVRMMSAVEAAQTCPNYFLNLCQLEDLDNLMPELLILSRTKDVFSVETEIGFDDPDAPGFFVAIGKIREADKRYPYTISNLQAMANLVELSLQNPEDFGWLRTVVAGGVEEKSARLVARIRDMPITLQDLLVANDALGAAHEVLAGRSDLTPTNQIVLVGHLADKLIHGYKTLETIAERDDLELESQDMMAQMPQLVRAHTSLSQHPQLSPDNQLLIASYAQADKPSNWSKFSLLDQIGYDMAQVQKRTLSERDTARKDNQLSYQAETLTNLAKRDELEPEVQDIIAVSGSPQALLHLVHRPDFKPELWETVFERVTPELVAVDSDLSQQIVDRLAEVEPRDSIG